MEPKRLLTIKEMDFMNKKEKVLMFIKTNKRKLVVISMLLIYAIIVIKDYGPIWASWFSH